MIKSAVGKVMWVGRATVFLVGLAVILAVVFGVASAAFGANGGNFILGALNTATAKTTLNMQGTGSAPALQVTQQSTGTGASGVGVSVPSGKAPIKVNSSAGKATNLNADKLDGTDATGFYAAGSKVDDSLHADTANLASNADKLDGHDGLDFQFAGALAGGDLSGNYPNPQIAQNAVGKNEIDDNGVSSSEVENGGLDIADVTVQVLQQNVDPPSLGANSCTTGTEPLATSTVDGGDFLVVNPPASLSSGLVVSALRVSTNAQNQALLQYRLCNATTNTIDEGIAVWAFIVFDDGNNTN